MQLAERTIVGRADGPHLLVTGGVHGDEFEPMAAIRRLIQQWPTEGLRGRVTLIPVVNEAAFRRGTRTADDGLDLARVCPGDPHGSISQRTAHALTERIRAADFYIDLHTGGTTMQIWPLAGYVLHREASVLETQRRMARAFNLPVVWGTSARLQGRSLSVARDANVPAIYTEYGGGGICRPEAVDAYVDGCLNVAAELGMIERRAVTDRVEYVVEDDRPESGHLQIQHPAPVEGFFEPAVALGDAIEAGRPLGWVVDLLGEQRVEVAANETGRVLLLRTFPRVAAGDTLGVILPITEPGSVQLTG